MGKIPAKSQKYRRKANKEFLLVWLGLSIIILFVMYLYNPVGFFSGEKILIYLGIVVGVFIITKFFGYTWTEIEEKEVPKWVLKAYRRWDRKIGTHPYNMTKHFVGKNFVYRVRHGMGGQGEAPITGWYRKRRRR